MYPGSGDPVRDVAYEDDGVFYPGFAVVRDDGVGGTLACLFDGAIAAGPTCLPYACVYEPQCGLLQGRDTFVYDSSAGTGDVGDPCWCDCKQRAAYNPTGYAV